MHLAKRLDERAHDKLKQADVLRRVLLEGDPEPVEAVEENRTAESNGRKPGAGRRTRHSHPTDEQDEQDERDA